MMIGTHFPGSKSLFVFQIRFYPRLSNLDNAFASEIRLVCSPFLINILDNILLVYCSDCKLTFYALDTNEGESGLCSDIVVTMRARLKVFQ